MAPAFKHTQTAAIAATLAKRQSIKRAILHKAKMVFDAAGVHFWLSCGVLLGYYRENDTIPHDPDVDLGLWAEDKPENLDEIMLAAGFQQCHHKHHNPDCIAYKYNAIKLDLFFHRHMPDGKVHLNLLDAVGNPVVYVYDAFDTIPVDFLGGAYRIPRNPLHMIQTQYGDKWYVPVSAWKWDRSPSHIAGNELRQNYWDNYYTITPNMPPSPFARHCMASGLIQGKILEFGCGDGRDAKLFLAAADSVTAIDQSAEGIAKLQDWCDGRWIHDDFTHLYMPEEHGTFDVIYSRFTLHSISELNERRALAAAGKLLKPGGNLLIEARSVDDPLCGLGIKIGQNAYLTDHYRRFLQLDSFTRRLRAAGFDIAFAQQSSGWAPTSSEDPPVIRVVATRICGATAPICITTNEEPDDWQKNVTAVVKTFEAPKSAACAVDSLRQHYPKMHIMVADDSLLARPMTGVEWHRLPYDTGLAAARNYMLERVGTPYFLLVDDDFIFTQDTDVRRLYDVLTKHDLDIVAGAVKTCGRQTIYHYEGCINVSDGNLAVDPAPRAAHADYEEYDLVLNFFLANTQSVRAIQWDPELKLSEHLEFFLRARGRLRIGYCKDVVVDHAKADKLINSSYRVQREAKALVGRAKMMEKHGLKSLYVNGVYYSYADVLARALRAQSALGNEMARIQTRTTLRSDPYPHPSNVTVVRHGSRRPATREPLKRQTVLFVPPAGRNARAKSR